MNSNWFGTSWKTVIGKVMNEWWENHPCGGRMSLAAQVLKFPHVLTNPGCVALSGNVHRCVALKINRVRKTWKLRIFWCYSSPCHMKHPQSLQQCLTYYKKFIWKNQVLVLLLLWCKKPLLVKKSRIYARVALQIWFLRYKKLWEKEILRMQCMNDFFLFYLWSPKAEVVKT